MDVHKIHKVDQEAKEDPDYYWENGIMVMTAAYHLKRGACCGNKCRHCPYNHINVPQSKMENLNRDIQKTE